MKRLVPRRIGPIAGTIAGVLVLLLFAGPFLLLGGRGSGSGGSSELLLGPGAGVPRGQIESLRLGESTKDVARRIGRGDDALQYGATGVAIEPMDASCTYYVQAGADRRSQLVQLCYRDDRLVSKRFFAPPAG